MIQASAEHDTTISQADIYRSKTLGDARGQKESRINTADADKARMVGLLGAEQTNFSRLLADYERNPALVKRLLQAETFKKSLGQRPVDRRPARPGNGRLRFHPGRAADALDASRPINPADEPPTHISDTAEIRPTGNSRKLELSFDLCKSPHC